MDASRPIFTGQHSDTKKNQEKRRAEMGRNYAGNDADEDERGTKQNNLIGIIHTAHLAYPCLSCSEAKMLSDPYLGICFRPSIVVPPNESSKPIVL
jgi:hypothetical protein